VYKLRKCRPSKEEKKYLSINTITEANNRKQSTQFCDLNSTESYTILRNLSIIVVFLLVVGKMLMYT